MEAQEGLLHTRRFAYQAPQTEAHWPLLHRILGKMHPLGLKYSHNSDKQVLVYPYYFRHPELDSGSILRAKREVLTSFEQ